MNKNQKWIEDVDGSYNKRKIQVRAFGFVGEDDYIVLPDQDFKETKKEVTMPHKTGGKYTSKPGHKKPVKKSTKKK